MQFSFSKKGLKKQAKEEVNAIKSNEKDKLKQIEGIFSQNLMNDLIRDKLKEIANLQDIVKTDGLSYKAKGTQVYNF